MELRLFVKEALKDILGAVEDAQKEVSSGEVVPNVIDNFQSVESGISNVQIIDFEVTVNTDESKGSEAKLNVVASIVGGGIGGKSTNSSAYASKLSFKVPVRFPKYWTKDEP